ncbi:hypothetical protein [Paenibacillus sp. CMAA1364]
MKRYLALATLVLVLGISPLSMTVKAEEGPLPLDKDAIRQQINEERINQVNYHVNEFEKLNTEEQATYLNEYDINMNNELLSRIDSQDIKDGVKALFEGLVR